MQRRAPVGVGDWRPSIPRIFVSHGVADPILPIDATNRIIPLLRGEGYDVHYQEFDGGHTVPAHIVREAADCFAAA